MRILIIVLWVSTLAYNASTHWSVMSCGHIPVLAIIGVHPSVPSEHLQQNGWSSRDVRKKPVCNIDCTVWTLHLTCWSPSLVSNNVWNQKWRIISLVCLWYFQLQRRVHVLFKVWMHSSLVEFELTCFMYVHVRCKPLSYWCACNWESGLVINWYMRNESPSL